MTLVPGKCYRGSGMVNEFGEMMFTPYQEGTSESDCLRTVVTRTCSEGSYSILRNSRTVCLRVSVPRRDQCPLLMHDQLRDLFILAILKLADYEI